MRRPTPRPTRSTPGAATASAITAAAIAAAIVAALGIGLTPRGIEAIVLALLAFLGARVGV